MPIIRALFGRAACQPFLFLVFWCAAPLRPRILCALNQVPATSSTAMDTVKPFLFGGLAGCGATVCVHPLDVIRVQIQISPPGETLVSVSKVIVCFVCCHLRRGGTHPRNLLGERQCRGNASLFDFPSFFWCCRMCVLLQLVSAIFSVVF